MKKQQMGRWRLNIPTQIWVFEKILQKNVTFGLKFCHIYHALAINSYQKIIKALDQKFQFWIPQNFGIQGCILEQIFNKTSSIWITLKEKTESDLKNVY